MKIQESQNRSSSLRRVWLVEQGLDPIGCVVLTFQLELMSSFRYCKSAGAMWT